MRKVKSPTCACGKPSEIGNYCRKCKRLRADEQQRQRRKRTCMTPGCKNTPSPKARLCTPCFVSIHPRQAAADARNNTRPDVREYMDARGMSYAKMKTRWDRPGEREKYNAKQPKAAGNSRKNIEIPDISAEILSIIRRDKLTEEKQENRHGAGLVIYHGEASQDVTKKKPARVRNLPPKPITQQEVDAFINQLERTCCNRRFWLRRKFLNLQTVPFWVSPDGREYQHCPGCGRAVD